MGRVVLGLWWLGWMVAQAPRSDQAPVPRVELGETVPDPVTAATTISFDILPEVCSRGHVPTVSLRIYNVLVQVVATPVLEGQATALVNQKLACGPHRAQWDGRVVGGRVATPGVYYYQLTVDGYRFTRKLIVPRRPAGST